MLNEPSDRRPDRRCMLGENTAQSNLQSCHRHIKHAENNDGARQLLCNKSSNIQILTGAEVNTEKLCPEVV